jgi:endonuclease I
VSDLPAPDGYYEGIDDLTAEQLKQKLRDIAGAGHNPINYKATRHLLKQIHEDPANKDNVITIYTRESVPKVNFVGEGNDPLWNREHVLPQSYSARAEDNARSDLHNLFPSIVSVSANRDSLYFDESDADAVIPLACSPQVASKRLQSRSPAAN